MEKYTDTAFKTLLLFFQAEVRDDGNQISSLDQLYSNEYLKAFREMILKHSSVYSMHAFKNYIEVQYAREKYLTTRNRRKHKELDGILANIPHTKTSFLKVASNNREPSLEILEKLVPLLRKALKDKLPIKSIVSLTPFKIQKKGFLEIPTMDHPLFYVKIRRFYLTYSENGNKLFNLARLVSPLYQLCTSTTSVNKAVSPHLKKNFHTFYDNDIRPADKIEKLYLEDKQQILDNVDFYNAIYDYNIFQRDPIFQRNHYYKKSKLLTNLRELHNRIKTLLPEIRSINIKRKNVNLTFSTLINFYGKETFTQIVKDVFDLVQSHYRIYIMIIALTFIRVFKYSLVKCDQSKIKDELKPFYVKLSEDNRFITFNGQNYDLIDFANYPDYHSVREKKNILEDALKTEKLNFIRLMNLTKTYSQK